MSKVVAVSGGFDPIHIGHVRMFEEAKKLGDKLVVIINNDNWLKTKKGFVFMPEQERAEVIKAFPFVDDVIITSHVINDADRSVCRELELLKPDIFANGGDRREEADIPEVATCKKYGIEMIFNIGDGGKVQSSSWLTDAVKGIRREERPWGKFELLAGDESFWIKILKVTAKQRLSLQTHTGRKEFWFCIEGTVKAEKGTVIEGKVTISEIKDLKKGDFLLVEQGEAHRLSSEAGGTIVEIALGNPIENDIVRYEDDYGRNETASHS